MEVVVRENDRVQLMAARVLGIVSNCWKIQLDRGQTLDVLIEQAVRQGLRAVELRQGCLGEYESALADDVSSAACPEAGLCGIVAPVS